MSNKPTDAEFFKAEFRTVIRCHKATDKELFIEVKSILESLYENETKILTRFELIALEEILTRFGVEKGFRKPSDISVLESVKDDEFPDNID